MRMSLHYLPGVFLAFTSGSFCLNLVKNLERSFVFLDWLSKKSNGTSDFWEASRANNLEPSILVSRF
jgi:hypothetical protein